MAAHSPVNTEDESSWEVIDSQVRECYGRIVYSHKVHEKNADIYLKKLRTTKCWQISLSALTTGGLFSILLTDGSKELTIITAIIASVQFWLNSYIKEYNLSESAERHASTASKLWNIRESYLSLIADIQAHLTTIEEIRQRRDDLQKQSFVVYEKAPRTISKAYKEAQKALKFNEELTFSNSEIDLLLPRGLRRNAEEIC